MSNPSSLSDRLSQAFIKPARGVLGLVDELLAASYEQEIHLAWKAGRCQVSFPRSEPPQRIDVPIQRSVVRAILARVAALCNERVPDSVSPYRGVGEIAADPTHSIRVRFVNTPDEQTLELFPSRIENAQQTEGPSLAGVVENVAHPSDRSR